MPALLPRHDLDQLGGLRCRQRRRNEFQRHRFGGERLQALENQISRLQRRLTILNQRSDKYSWIRLAIFLIGLAFSILAFILLGWLVGLILAAITITAFSIVVYYHRKIDRSITRHNILMHIKATQVARIQLDWARIPAVRSSEARTSEARELTLPASLRASPIVSPGNTS